MRENLNVNCFAFSQFTAYKPSVISISARINYLFKTKVFTLYILLWEEFVWSKIRTTLTTKTVILENHERKGDLIQIKKKSN